MLYMIKNNFHRLISFTLALLLVLGLGSGFGGAALAYAQTTTSSTAMTRDELAAQIQAKALQLDDINKQLESTRQSLKKTTQEKLTLQNALNAIQKNIDQLNLNIQADQITVQKLNLEIESLNYDLQDIQSSIADKQAAIDKTMIEIQKNDKDSNNLLVVFLRNNSLADAVLETQNLKNLQLQLGEDIENLRALREEYSKDIKAASDKRESIALHKQDLENRKLIIQDQKTEKQTILAKTKNQESIFAKQLSDLEKQQLQIANEIEALDAILRSKIDPSVLPTPGHGVLLVPINGGLGNITQDYGATAFAKNGYQGKWHNGIDIGALIGTPVLAADDGEVVAVGNQDLYCYRGAYGKFIVIKHNNNLATLYAHLSLQIVKNGAIVKRGQVIGYSGKTGYATGPHLHFTVFAGPTFYMGPSKTCGPMPYGGDLNPLGYL